MLAKDTIGQLHNLSSGNAWGSIGCYAAGGGGVASHHCCSYFRTPYQRLHQGLLPGYPCSALPLLHPLVTLMIFHKQIFLGLEREIDTHCTNQWLGL